MVTSHDIPLTDISEKFELKSLNVHFAHTSTHYLLRFDYHLRAGKVGRSNVIQIIRMIGIPIH